MVSYRAFFANKRIFQSKLISKKSKIKLYKALIRPVVVYGSECWVLTENIKQKLLVFERRILRRTFGPTQKANGEWRLKTNEELEHTIGYENIVRHIKSKRLSWLGHVERMPNERVAKTIYKWKPYATRPPKLGTRVRLIWGDEAFTETNFTPVFLFVMYDIYVATVSSLIKLSFTCDLKSFTTFP